MEVVNSDDGSGSVKRGRLKVSMIRRMNNAPQRINPSGLVMETKPSGTQSSPPPNPMESNPLVISESPKSIPLDITAESPPIIEIRQPTGDAMYENPAESTSMYRPPTLSLANRRITRDARQNSILHDDRIGGPAMGRSQTIEFSLTRPDRVHTMDVRADSANPNGQLLLEKPEVRHSYSDDPNLHRNWTRESMERSEQLVRLIIQDGLILLLFKANSRNPPGFPRTVSMASHKRRGSMHTGFGGFPTPYRVAIKLVSWVAPTTAERIRKRVTMPATHSMSIKKTKSIAAETIDAALYSQHRMKEEDLEFLGGVEYKSLKLLRLILLCLIAFAIIGPESARRKWLPVFENQPRFVPPAWFALFQVTSAYTNTGTSLCDQSMIPFQNASLMIIVMFVLILAGNTAF
ncbi:low affinity potassium transporter, partial [Serendipita sp. 399]